MDAILREDPAHAGKRLDVQDFNLLRQVVFLEISALGWRLVPSQLRELIRALQVTGCPSLETLFSCYMTATELLSITWGNGSYASGAVQIPILNTQAVSPLLFLRTEVAALKAADLKARECRKDVFNNKVSVP